MLPSFHCYCGFYTLDFVIHRQSGCRMMTAWGGMKEGRHTEKRSDVVINQVKSFSKQFPLPFAYRRTLAKRHALASNDKRFPRSRIHSTAGKEMSYKASLVSKSVRLSNATRVHNLTVQISKAQQLNLSAGSRFIHER